MHDYKLIKKIFNLARYDFINNFTNLLSIAGLHAIIISTIFCILLVITSYNNYDIVISSVKLWNSVFNIFFDWAYLLLFLTTMNIHVWILSVIYVIVAGSLIILALISMQNSLDLAFDSSMSGYSIHKKSMFLSFIAMLISAIGVTTFIALFFKIYFLVPTYLIPNMVFSLSSFYIFLFFIFYFLYVISFVGMHVLEYKSGLIESFRDVFNMMRTKILFVGKTYLLQFLISTAALLFFYVALKGVVGFCTGGVTWIFYISNIDISTNQPFLHIIYNFFYLWLYLLLYTWICLLTAHVYRQLVCPPVDNAPCLSCKSCEK